MGPKTKGKTIWVFLFLFWMSLPASAAPSFSPPIPESYVRVPNEKVQAMVRKGFGPGWRLVETDHFKVFSNSSPRYQKVSAGLAEQFYLQVYPRFFRRPLPQINVFLGDQREDFERLVKPICSFPNLSGYIGFSSGGKSIYTYRWYSKNGLVGTTVLYHELIHTFVDTEAGGRSVPLWFNEGFACLFESAGLVRGHWLYGNPSLARDTDVRSLLESGHYPPLNTFLHFPDEAFRVDPHFTYYGVGRSFFLFLLLQKGEPALRDFCQKILRGEEASRALRTVTGEPLEKLDEEWAENIRRVNFSAAVRAKAIWPYGFYAVSMARSSDSYRVLRKGLKEFPHYGGLHLSLAEIDRAAGLRQEALEQALAALKDPRMANPIAAHRVIAWAYTSSDPSKAMAAYQRIVDDQPWLDYVDRGDFQKYADLKRQHNDPKGADELLKKLAQMLEEDKVPPLPESPKILP